MILWTIQPEEVLEILYRDGVYTCDEKLCEGRDMFYEEYIWMVQQMDNRGIKHPEGVRFPVWAWHTRNWKRKRPKLKQSWTGQKGKRMVCIEFEIPDDEVLLSDFESWHFVLNDSWYDNSDNEEEWDANQTWYDALPKAERERLKQDSWQRIFDIAPYKSDWKSNGRYVQATFWELKVDMVRKVKRFKDRK